MSNITVAEMLKIHGKWIQTKPFVNLISEKLGITERMAYIKIKKATEKKEIIKVTLQNRNVIYGLAEFGSYHSEHVPKVPRQNDKQTKHLSDRDLRKRLKIALDKLEEYQRLLIHAELIQNKGVDAKDKIELLKNAINRQKDYITLLRDK